MSRNNARNQYENKFRNGFERILKNKKWLFALAGLVGGAASGLVSSFSSILEGNVSSWVLTGALDAALIGIAIVSAQAYYVSRRAASGPALRGTAVLGVLAGGAGGVIAMFFMNFLGAGEFARMLGWGISGAAAGFVVSRRVPNFGAKEAAVAGAIGAMVGSQASMLGLGYTVGVSISGAAIGLSVVMAEQILRKQWVRVLEYSHPLPDSGVSLAKMANDYTLTLGDTPIRIGYSEDMDVRVQPVGVALEKHVASLEHDNGRYFLQRAGSLPREEVFGGVAFRVSNCQFTVNA